MTAEKNIKNLAKDKKSFVLYQNSLVSFVNTRQWKTCG